MPKKARISTDQEVGGRAANKADAGLRGRLPGILVFFGLIATGKSTLATKWAASHGATCFNSDRVRKELAGPAASTGSKESLDQGIYSREFTRRTYDALLGKAETECRAGRTVVLDASYRSRAERDRVRALAARLRVDVLFVFCNCPEEEIMRRLAIRSRDPEAVSDGRPAIYLAQKERFEYPEELSDNQLVTLATVGNPDDLLAELDMIFEVRPYV
ncbi:MAG: ATP-binding protein [Desulfurivibrionaceae bacterium]|nr:ATP-binding protein [Desulfobulbales bacterium]MDT8335777.1 ATP-binding protein [Desulfurivibrionaceae bacterium]